jgi:membrane-associated phospholipid phosphatase
MEAERAQASWREKLAVWLGLAVGICVPYFSLQRASSFPVLRVPETSLDRAIAFEPDWIWIYVSIAVLVPLAPALARDRTALRRYAAGLACLCLPCFALFFLLPVEGPRPSLVPEHALYGWIVSVDRSTNSLPSLHAGLALYSLLYIGRVLQQERGPARGALRLAGWLWGAAILYSTLATKQHWVVDLPAGMAIAFCAHRLAWRRA